MSMFQGSSSTDLNPFQSSQVAGNMPVQAPEAPILTVCVIGSGDEAQNLALRICGRGHKVARIPGEPMSKLQSHFHHNQLSKLQPDVIVFATQTKHFRQAVTNFPPTLFANVLVVSYLPVMAIARDLFVTFLPPSAGIIVAGQIIGDWYRRPFFVDLIRIQKGKIHQSALGFLKVIKNQECRLAKLCTEEFDAAMAYSQFIATAIGKTLGEFHLTPTPCDDESSDVLLQVADLGFMASEDIFYALFLYNPNAKDALKELEKGFKKVIERLEEREEADMRRRREELRKEASTRAEDIFAKLSLGN